MRWSGDAQADLSALCIGIDATLFEALQVVDRGAQSIAFVVDGTGRVLGTLTDGDLRRAILGGASLQDRCLRTAMRSDFASVSKGEGRAEVLDIMQARDIGQLPVLDAAGRLTGLHTIGHLLSATELPNWVAIMAGGRGTRLQHVTQTVPKPMVKVAGRPILERLILHLMGSGLKRFFISVNYLAEVIEQHFGDGSKLGCRIEYLRETQPLGTGGSLALIKPRPTHPILVVNGDLVTQCDVASMIEFHQAGGFAATFGLRQHDVHIPFGVARVEGDRLVELREKPSEQFLINAGLYVLSPEALDLIPPNEAFPITEMFHRCSAKQLPVGAHIVQDDWIDVGQPSDLRRARGES
jgi:dTDP-glucose pyrophosphorylase